MAALYHRGPVFYVQEDETAYIMTGREVPEELLYEIGSIDLGVDAEQARLIEAAARVLANRDELTPGRGERIAALGKRLLDLWLEGGRSFRTPCYLLNIGNPAARELYETWKLKTGLPRQAAPTEAERYGFELGMLTNSALEELEKACERAEKELHRTE